MPCPEAVAAMRGALDKTSGRTKVGVINSLGIRRDAESTKALVTLLGNSDNELAAAAAAALGGIGTSEAAEALASFQTKAPKELKLAAADAYLTCAEKLLADGKKDQAKQIYSALLKSEMKHVKAAATLGLLAVARGK
jgi:TolA-binding protein